MTEPTLRNFDVPALYAALDARRVDLGLSWKQVADQLWALSADLNERRDDHPISPSTLTRMADHPRTSCQHALFMLRWLDRSPESFLRGATADDTGAVLPSAGADQRLRWDLRSLYEAMDGQRRREGRTWPELAVTLRCTPHQLTGLRTVKFAIDMGLTMRIVQWLGRPSSDFIRAAAW
jgi:hypothetical protein